MKNVIRNPRRKFAMTMMTEPEKRRGTDSFGSFSFTSRKKAIEKKQMKLYKAKIKKDEIREKARLAEIKSRPEGEKNIKRPLK